MLLPEWRHSAVMNVRLGYHTPTYLRLMETRQFFKATLEPHDNFRQKLPDISLES